MTQEEKIVELEAKLTNLISLVETMRQSSNNVFRNHNELIKGLITYTKYSPQAGIYRVYNHAIDIGVKIGAA